MFLVAQDDAIKPLAERLPESTPILSAPVDRPFVGTDQCIKCHREQAATWSETKHALAFEHLPAQYQSDASCLTCHVLGFNNPGGYTLDAKPDERLPFESVGCEACHGPGAAHIEAVKRWTLSPTNADEPLLAEIKAAIVKTPSIDQCATCHQVQAHQSHPSYVGQPVAQMLSKPATVDSSFSLPNTLPSSPHGYSVKTCASCHISQYTRWQSESHSRIIASLPNKYAADDSCLKCHGVPDITSEWYATSADCGANADRVGVGCENCHGPALRHVLFNKVKMVGPNVPDNVVQSARETFPNPKTSLACLQCHISQAHQQHPPFDKSDAAPTN